MFNVVDVFDEKNRSEIMSKVHSKGNKSTELKLKQVFKENGIIGWKRNYPVKGHPDFVFLNKKVAIFVDGCFWHGHDCRNTRPSDNADYWTKKRERNMKHDKEITDYLNGEGGRLFGFGNANREKESSAVDGKNITMS